MSYALSSANQNSLAQVQGGRFDREALYRRFIEFLDARPKTVATYAVSLRQLMSWLADHGVAQPSRGDLIAWRESLKTAGRKPTTIQAYVIAARQFFKFLASEGLYPNIAENLKGAKLDPAHKKDCLSADQGRAVLAGFDRESLKGKRDYAVFALMICCGLRDIEVSRANMEDLRTVSGRSALYLCGKGRDERTEYVLLPEAVELAIRDYLKARGHAEDRAPLFEATGNRRSPDGRLSTHSISRMIKASLRGAGFDSSRLTAHSLRHTAITLALVGGASLDEARQFARHASINTTEIYNHSLERAKNPCSRKVSAMLF